MNDLIKRVLKNLAELGLDVEGIVDCSRCGEPNICREFDGKQVCFDCATPLERAEVNARTQCDCPKCSARGLN